MIDYFVYGAVSGAGLGLFFWLFGFAIRKAFNIIKNIKY
jgi:hypothetical protein